MSGEDTELLYGLLGKAKFFPILSPFLESLLSRVELSGVELTDSQKYDLEAIKKVMDKIMKMANIKDDEIKDMGEDEIKKVIDEINKTSAKIDIDNFDINRACSSSSRMSGRYTRKYINEFIGAHFLKDLENVSIDTLCLILREAYYSHKEEEILSVLITYNSYEDAKEESEYEYQHYKYIEIK
jgi:hypothetical protein